MLRGLGMVVDLATEPRHALKYLLARFPKDGGDWRIYRVDPREHWSFYRYSCYLLILSMRAHEQGQCGSCPIDAGGPQGKVKFKVCFADSGYTALVTYLYNMRDKAHRYKGIPLDLHEGLLQSFRPVAPHNTAVLAHIAVDIPDLSMLRIWPATGFTPPGPDRGRDYTLIPASKLPPVPLIAQSWGTLGATLLALPALQEKKPSQKKVRRIRRSAKAPLGTAVTPQSSEAWQSQVTQYLGRLRESLRLLGLHGLRHPGDRASLYIDRQLVPRCADVRFGGLQTDNRVVSDRDEEAVRRSLPESDLLKRLQAAGVPARLCLLDEAGSGKSTLLEQLAWRMAEVAGGTPDDRGRRIPFLVHLRNWRPNTHRTLAEFIHDYAATIDETCLEQLCTTGRVALFVDGLDEVHGGAKRRHAATEWLASELNRPLYVTCGVFLAGRPWAFDGTVLRQFRAVQLRIRELELSDVADYISRYFSRRGPQRVALQQQLSTRDAATRHLKQPLLLMLTCFLRESEIPGHSASATELLEGAVRELLRQRQLPEEHTLWLLGRLAWICWTQGLDRMTEMHALEAVAKAVQSESVGSGRRSSKTPDALLGRILRRSGLFVKDGAQCRFEDMILAEYLAGRDLATQPEPTIVKRFREHAWNPRWTRIFLFAQGRLWATNGESAGRLVRWLLNEIEAGHDDVFRSLTFMACRLLSGAKATPGDEWRDILTRLSVLACGAWHWTMNNSAYDERRDVAHQALLELANLEDTPIIDFLPSALADPATVADAARILSAIGSEGSRAIARDALALTQPAEVRAAVIEALGCDVGALERAMCDSEAEIRAAAAEALGRLRVEDAVDLLSKALADENSVVRGSAVQSLGLIRAVGVIDRVVDLLWDDDPAIRPAAAMAAERIGADSAVRAIARNVRRLNKHAARLLCQADGKEGVRILQQGLTQSDDAVRQCAADALRDADPQYRLDAILCAARDRSELVRIAAIEALASHHEPEATALLVSMLNDGSEKCDVRVAAADALGHAKEPDSTPALVAALGDHDKSLRLSAVRALGRIADVSTEDAMLGVFASEDADLYREAALALVPIVKWNGQRAVELLLRRLRHRDTAVSEHAAHALGWLGTADNPTVEHALGHDVAAEIRDHIARLAVVQLKKRIAQEAGGPNEAVLEALCCIGTESAVAAVVEVLPRIEATVRRKTILRLGATGIELAVDALVTHADDSESDLQNDAAWALARGGSIRAEKCLLSLCRSKDEDLRIAAIWGLGKIGSPQARKELTRAISDPCSAVRVGAVEALGQVGTTPAVQHLVKALADPDVGVSASAAEALGLIGAPAAVPALCNVLTKESEALVVRIAAADALGKIGSTRGVTALLRALSGSAAKQAERSAGRSGGHDRSDSEHLSSEGMDNGEALEATQFRDAVIGALGAIGSSSAVRGLIDLRLRGVDDTGVVASALCQIRAPHCAKALAQTACAEHAWAGQLLDVWCAQENVTVLETGRLIARSDHHLHSQLCPHRNRSRRPRTS